MLLHQSGDLGDDGPIDPEVLRLSNVTHEDEGYYSCVAGNTLGMTYAMAYLRVVDGKSCSRSPPLLIVAFLEFPALTASSLFFSQQRQTSFP